MAYCRHSFSGQLACAEQDAQAYAQEARQEVMIRHAFALAGQYIALAQVLQPGREVYQRSLGVSSPASHAASW